jgi:hypothetical protein
MLPVCVQRLQNDLRVLSNYGQHGGKWEENLSEIAS